ncbi:hypothetical protein NQ318_017972 [Aromia moschata]|uniref:Uncharacterized protein n=1 Tax=Aromia moschata TaxID=1265417 RepID=A0AAV8XK54_9CUCU|nr:hypothetical protein NQ318_017972 [Aromia moschata]
MEVALAFVENPRSTIRKVEQMVGMDKKLVHKVLKEMAFHPYKVHLVQELIDGDPDRRIEFCEVMMQMIHEDPGLISNICFSDESTFVLNGEVKRHNCRYWSDENPHWMLKSCTQYPEKVNVWAGILDDRLIGPFFIEGNLTAVKY